MVVFPSTEFIVKFKVFIQINMHIFEQKMEGVTKKFT